MKVYVCDFCESIIKNPTDRKIVKIKKNYSHIDYETGFDIDYFYAKKHTLCPSCYKHMIEYIEDMRKVEDELIN
jgi:hypothetical protein